MIEWLVLVGGCAGVAGAARIAAVRNRRHAIPLLPDRLSPKQLGLERFPAQGAFVQFSTPYSTSSRVSLNRLAAVSAHLGGRVTVVEIGSGPKTGLRATPMVLYVDAGGTVRRRWSSPPERVELDALVAELQSPAEAGSAAKSFA
jgi:hypothetical protein